MKIRQLVAVAGATILVTLVAASNSVAIAPSYNYGTRATPAGAVAGGARIAVVVRYAPVGKSTKPSPSGCSTGVPWQLANGTRGFLTAGHCLPANVRSGTQIIRSASGSSWVPGAPLGARPPSMTTFNNAQGTIPGKVGDIAFVPSKLPVGNYVFTGGPTSRSLTRITSWATRATPGYRLCFSGYVTGSRCGLIQGKISSYRAGKAKVTGIAEAYYPPGSTSQRCTQPGDSGGVVYRMSPDGRFAYVVGIISGSGNPSGPLGRFVAGCSVYYTPLGAAQKQFGGGPILS